MLLKHLLSKQDAIYLLELIYTSLYCTNEELKEITKKLEYLISYDFAICRVDKTGADGMMESCDIVNINYPPEWLELYIMRKYHQIDPIAKENFKKFSLQYWADTCNKNASPEESLSLVEDYGLKGGYTHGVRSLHGSEGGLLSIAGKSVEHHNRSEVILKHVIPHFHQALIRILDRNNGKRNIPLSPREMEVLNWIKHGKSTWDISVILGISERTVKYHVSRIMQKLDAVSRTQAVAIAFERGLIDIE